MKLFFRTFRLPQRPFQLWVIVLISVLWAKDKKKKKNLGSTFIRAKKIDLCTEIQINFKQQITFILILIGLISCSFIML